MAGPEQEPFRKGGCLFCDLEGIQETEEKKSMAELLMGFIPDTGELIECNRGIHMDKRNIWFATLALEQYSIGHTLVVLDNHRNDITDESLTSREREAMMEGVSLCSRELKKRLCHLRNVGLIRGLRLIPKKIYVASLCDGVEHLHFHLIPRYATDTIGFGFLGEREHQHTHGFRFFPDESITEKVRWFRELAEELRF